jgi:two-component system, cell cycle response regulator
MGEMQFVAIALAAAVWGHALLGVGSDNLFARWVIVATAVAAALACARHARRAPLVWGAFAVGLFAHAAGDIIYSAQPNLVAVPVPSVSDPLWLAIYPCAYLALMALTRRRVGRLLWTTRIDGLIGGLAVAAVLACLTVPSAAATIHGAPLSEQITTLAYPLGDLALLGAIVIALAAGGWRLDSGLAVLAGGVVLWEIGDLMYLHNDTGTLGNIADAFVVTGIAAFGVAASLPTRAASVRARGLLLPVAFGAVALFVVALARPLHLSSVGLGAAIVALALVLVRTAIALHEHHALLTESRTEAATDALTGLSNRRAFHTALDAIFAGGERHALILLDLNGFKGFNDTFGHAAGDELLVAFAHRLAAVVGDGATAFRLGGDEFCVLAPCQPHAADTVARRCARALSTTREGRRVSAACGVVSVPGEHADPAAALAAADALMYRDKRAGGTAALAA